MQGSAENSKRESSLELYEPWGSVSTEERSEDAGWGTYRADNHPEVRAGNIADELIKVAVVEEIEELSSRYQTLRATSRGPENSSSRVRTRSGRKPPL